MNYSPNSSEGGSETSKATKQKEPSGSLRRFTHGSLANILNKIINIFGQLLLVPIFLTYWGNQLYGEWLALSAIVGYLSLIDFGLQTFVLNRLNQSYTKNNLDQYLRIFHSAYWLSIVISITAIIFAVTLLGFLPFENLLSFEITDHEAAVKFQ